MSRYELKIENILRNNYIEYEKEFTFSNLKFDGSLLRFDFALFKRGELKCLIEVDGEQHFSYIEFFGTKSNFKHMQQNDRRKNKYCLLNNIPLYRIPYWDLEKIKCMEDILKDKYKVINKNHNDNLKKE